MRRMMTLILLTMMTRGSTVAAEPEVLLEFRPVTEISKQAKPSTGPNGEPAIEVNGEPGKATFTLIICDQPKVSMNNYQVRGRVKYSDVEGDGYLELLNDFGEPYPYFTRSLLEFGPLRKLNGTSDWREFALPFHADPGKLPKRLTLNIVLPVAGQVTVAQPVLEGLFNSSGEWWSEWQAGLFGGIGGSLIGIMGGLLGTFMTWAQTRLIVRRIYPFALAACYALLALGVVAVCLRQPYHVYYPILLIGGIGSLCLQFNYSNVYQRIQADELRKMTALDVN